MSSTENNKAVSVIESSEDSKYHQRVLEDGITHINIDQRGQTPIGRAIGHYSETPFKHHQLGYFISMMAFWSFIRAVDPTDEMRYLVGPIDWLKAKRIEARKIDQFQEILEDGYMQMFCQNQALGDWVADTTLPFDSYYIHTDSTVAIGDPASSIVVRGKAGSWFVPMIERVRARLQRDEPPKYVDCSELVNYANERGSK